MAPMGDDGRATLGTFDAANLMSLISIRDKRDALASRWVRVWVVCIADCLCVCLEFGGFASSIIARTHNHYGNSSRHKTERSRRVFAHESANQHSNHKD